MDLRERAFSLKFALARRHALPMYERLYREQFCSADELAEKNWIRTRQILQLAYERSPFYQQLYRAAGLVPNDIREPTDFVKVPSITKEQIRENFQNIRVSGCRSSWCAPVSTGGSTGVPLTVLHDRRVPIETASWRVLRWWGCEPWDDKAIVNRVTKTGVRKLISDLTWFPSRTILLDASRLSDALMRDFVESVNELRPPILQGYVGAVHELAQFIQRSGQSVCPPKGVWVTSAPLTESQREFMQSVFRSPVYDQYGSCEVFWLAAECRERNGLHSFSDIRRIEFVRDDDTLVDAGEVGDILVTDLENRVFPIIRYRIGDRGSWRRGSCQCGVKLPLIDKVAGRVSDVLRFPGRYVMSGEFLTTIFDDAPQAVQNFQVFQHRDGTITLRCVLGTTLNALAAVQTTKDRLQKQVGPGTTVRLEIVDRIPHDRGKAKFVVSEFPPRHVG